MTDFKTVLNDQDSLLVLKAARAAGVTRLDFHVEGWNNNSSSHLVEAWKGTKKVSGVEEWEALHRDIEKEGGNPELLGEAVLKYLNRKRGGWSLGSSHTASGTARIDTQTGQAEGSYDREWNGPGWEDDEPRP